jgi:hypothetical protein
LKANKKIEEKALTLKFKKMYNKRYRHKWTNPKPDNCLKCGEFEHWAQECMNQKKEIILKNTKTRQKQVVNMA